jgi:hypothetical protein
MSLSLPTSTAVVNAAIEQIGDNVPPVTGAAPNFDSSPAGIAAAALYAQTVETVAREFGWDFSRSTLQLQLSGNAAPLPWAKEYLYPAGVAQIRQLMPAALADANNPLPVNWAVANAVVNGQRVKVIECNIAGAQAVVTNLPPESTWDALFTERVVRLLASGLAMALEGRPETAKEMYQTAEQFGAMGQARDS